MRNYALRITNYEFMKYTNIFDSHAHYDDGWFDKDRESLLEALPSKGVCGVVNNAVDLESAKTWKTCPTITSTALRS